MVEDIIFSIVSLAIAAGAFFIARGIINLKLGRLHGSQKLLGIITIVIIITEIGYLGIKFGLFSFALEIITSIGVGMVILGIAMQHQLKNIVAGIGVFFNSDIDVGDIVAIKEAKGTIIEIHLTKTVALTEDGERIMIPNQKFAEEVVIVYHKKSDRSKKHSV